MKNLQSQIAELKQGRSLATLKKEDRKAYYKVQSLSEKLSHLKAIEKGNFVTKEHLSEFKGLIIYVMRKVDFYGYLDLKAAMTDLLSSVEAKELVYKTERGIKNLIAGEAKHVALNSIYKRLVDLNGIDITTDNTLNNDILASFQEHRLDALMS